MVGEHTAIVERSAGYVRRERHCSRSGCGDPAAVTLTYHYASCRVWLDDLAGERDPHAYDLCAGHTSRLSVPVGWHLEDRRRPSASALIAS